MAREQLEPQAGLVRLVKETIVWPKAEDIARSVQQMVARYDLLVNGAPPSELNPYGVKPRTLNGWVELGHLNQGVEYKHEAAMALRRAGVMTVGEYQGNGEGEPVMVTLDRSALDTYLEQVGSDRSSSQ